MSDDTPDASRLSRRTLLKGAAAAGLVSATTTGGLGAAPTPARSNGVQAENARAGTTDWQLTYTRVDPKTRYRSPWIEGYASRQRQGWRHTRPDGQHQTAGPIQDRHLSLGVLRRRRWPAHAVVGAVRGYRATGPARRGRAVARVCLEVEHFNHHTGRLAQRRLPGEAVARRRSLSELRHLHRPRRSPGRHSLSVQRQHLAGLQSLARQLLALRRRPDRNGHWSRACTSAIDRPYGKYCQMLDAPLSQGSGEFLLWEFPLAFWLEQQGYDVTYCSNTDVHADPTGSAPRQGVPLGRARRVLESSSSTKTWRRRSRRA